MPAKEVVILQFEEWLDTQVIADAVWEEIEEGGEKPTFMRMREVYLSFLDDLHQNIRQCL